MRSLVCLVVLAGACGASSSGPDGAAAAPDGPAAPDTWDSWGREFFVTYCNGCHSEGGSGFRMGELDYTTMDDVVTNAAEIRCGPAPVLVDGCTGFPPAAQFPIAAPYPSDEDRTRLVSWIGAGTP